MENSLGILGGMGPMAGALFYKKITEKTAADADQEHINIILLSNVEIPDRSASMYTEAYGLVYDRLHEDCKTLEKLGCKAICASCNTAHYYLHKFDDLSIPVISMIKHAATEMGKLHKGEKVAILATDGTIRSGLYQEALAEEGVEAYIPSQQAQKEVMHLIYGCIKKGLSADGRSLAFIDAELKKSGCKRALLACTELSVIKTDENLPDFYVDPMDIMVEKAIEFMGKKVRREA